MTESLRALNEAFSRFAEAMAAVAEAVALFVHTFEMRPVRRPLIHNGRKPAGRLP
jgi:hypothetical protein